MRVDVDFNERDRDGHVVARVPGDLATRLVPGRRVNLYDPLEQLWAEASVTRVNTETRIAAFDVDWESVEDAEVAEVADGREHWFVGITPTEGFRLPPSLFAENCNAAQAFTWAIQVQIDTVRTAPGTAIYIVGSEHEPQSSSATGTLTPVAIP